MSNSRLPLAPLLPVLIVEDNEDHLELTREALFEAGLQNRIDAAATVREALAYLNARRPGEADTDGFPCVILLDIRLPDGSGMEVLRTIKRDDELRAIPVVMLTSSADTPDIEKAYLLGANSYLVKPVSFEDFSRRIQEAGLYWALLNQPYAHRS